MTCVRYEVACSIERHGFNSKIYIHYNPTKLPAYLIMGKFRVVVIFC